MICYFSGTGNSRRAALQIAEVCGDTVFSINQSMRAGRSETLHSDKPFVFVAPTYGWRMPRVVARWMEKSALIGSRDVYFILTCGSECGNAAPYVQALCKRRGLTFRGLGEVVMPENYLALFPTPNQVEAEEILAASLPRIQALAESIRDGKTLPVTRPSLSGRIKSGVVNPLFYLTTVSDKGFAAGDGCVGCKLCAGRCPLGNITMDHQKPRWNGNCTHCMACIGGCPTQAIEYKENSKGRPRYYITEETP